MAGLKGRERSLTRTLSVGWKQRLALGCAVLHEPGIVFLVEPTGGVDPASRRRFWELINELSARKTTVFVTTHYLDEAEYCNDLRLIHAGRIVAGGSPSELKSEVIRNPILEVSSPRAVDSLEALRKEPWVLETSIFGTTLHVSVADEAEGRRLILERLARAGIVPERVDRIVPSLEDVFIHKIEEQSADAKNGEAAP
jgi:ABC-2 type transport system ATP-binding protein